MAHITTAMLNNRQYQPGKKYDDDSNEGLRLEVYKNGRMIWFARYRDKWHGGRYAMKRLGEFFANIRATDPRYPLHVGLHAARTACNAVRAANQQGLRKSEGEHLTLAQDMEDWLEYVKKNHKHPDKAAAHRRDMLTRHMPQLLKMRTIDITKQDIIAALDYIVNVTAKQLRGRRTKPTDLITTTKEARYFLRDIFDRALHGPFGDRWPTDASNPVADLMRYKLGKHRKKHRKAMKLEDVQEFYAKLMRANSTEINAWFRSRAAIALRLVLLTLAPRVNEIVSATWGQIVIDASDPRWTGYPEWWCPGFNLKIEKDRGEDDAKKRPLSPQAVALLLSFKPDGAKPTDFLFPSYARSKDGAPRFLDYSKPMQTLSPVLWMRHNGYVDETVHGMRTLLVNFAVKMDKSLIMAAQSGLDHNLLPGTATKDYIDNELPDDMRKLAQLVADFLEPATPIVLAPTERGRRTPRKRTSDGRFQLAEAAD